MNTIVPPVEDFCDCLNFLDCPHEEADWLIQIIDQSNRFLTLLIYSGFANIFDIRYLTFKLNAELSAVCEASMRSKINENNFT